MRKSPLIIESYFVKKVQFELRPGFDRSNSPESETIEPTVKIYLESEKYPEDRNTWRFELSIDSDENSPDADFPYTFDITLVGLFRVDESYPAENADLLAQVNAPSVLYSAAREFLINITGRSSYSPILLPSVSFVPEPNTEKPKRRNTVKKVKPKK